MTINANMKKAELLKIAVEKGLKVSEKDTKEVIIKAIETAENFSIKQAKEDNKTAENMLYPKQVNFGLCSAYFEYSETLHDSKLKAILEGFKANQNEGYVFSALPRKAFEIEGKEAFTVYHACIQNYLCLLANNPINKDTMPRLDKALQTILVCLSATIDEIQKVTEYKNVHDTFKSCTRNIRRTKSELGKATTKIYTEDIEKIKSDKTLSDSQKEKAIKAKSEQLKVELKKAGMYEPVRIDAVSNGRFTLTFESMLGSILCDIEIVTEATNEIPRRQIEIRRKSAEKAGMSNTEFNEWIKKADVKGFKDRLKEIKKENRGKGKEKKAAVPPIMQ